MTIRDGMQQYVDKKQTALEFIRSMTAMLNTEQAVNLLELINQITRIEAGTLSIETFKKVYNLE